VIGARSNRNGIMVDVCQAVTGLAPEFGFRPSRRGGFLLINRGTRPFRPTKLRTCL